MGKITNQKTSQEKESPKERPSMFEQIQLYVHIYFKVNVWRALHPKPESDAAYRNEIVCLSKPLGCNFSLGHVSTTNPFSDVQLLPIQSMD